MLVCPGREQLRRYLNNELSAAVERAVLEHVDECSACQHELEDLTAGRSQAGSEIIEPTEAPPATWLNRLIAAGSGGQSTITTNATSRPEDVRHEMPTRVGPYELLRELGRGGMGVVYVARQENLNRLVALKMILAGDHAGGSAHRAAALRGEGTGPVTTPQHRPDS